MPNRRFFTANQLKAIALFCMLLDHMWATIVPGREWMTCVGRIAFPIFAFELAQGYTHTHGPARLRQAAAVAGRRVRGAF